MTTPHFAALPASAADRDGRAWIAPALATVLLALLGPLALLFGGLSGMATDACGPDDCSQALETSLTLIYGTLFFGSLASVAALLAAWLLPWRRRWSQPRAWLAAASLLPPLFVLLLVFTLPNG
ncbi:hypothetical protein ACFW6K_09530 [Streptomyces sp. NPDC058733]|uniref:hypothetical protein n=1 Tax=unclassified Streptomyces TaxID=2593676 RepID=UPI003455CB8F